MTFAVPAAETPKDGYFEFTVPGSKTKHKAPLLKHLPFVLVDSILTDRQTRRFLPVFGGEDSATGKAVRTLTPVQFEALVKAWGDASGITLGESKASSDS